jgi:cardiolipin synthase
MTIRPDAAQTWRLLMADGFDHGADAALLTASNLVSIARLCAVPLAVWLVLQQRLAAAFFLFAAAGLSDAADGWLARRNGSRSTLGAVLDPLADKALLTSMYVTLAAVRILPDWLAILVVFRDVLIVGGVLAMSVAGHKVAIRPMMLSKVNTVLQIALVAAALLLNGFSLRAPGLLDALVAVAAASTLASGAAYAWRGARA